MYKLQTSIDTLIPAYLPSLNRIDKISCILYVGFFCLCYRLEPNVSTKEEWERGVVGALPMNGVPPIKGKSVQVEQHPFIENSLSSANKG